MSRKKNNVRLRTRATQHNATIVAQKARKYCGMQCKSPALRKQNTFNFHNVSKSNHN